MGVVQDTARAWYKLYAFMHKAPIYASILYIEADYILRQSSVILVLCLWAHFSEITELGFMIYLYLLEHSSSQLFKYAGSSVLVFVYVYIFGNVCD